MNTKKIILAIFFFNAAHAMENKITIIAVNPERHPELFFETLEERIVSQVKKTKDACVECNRDLVHSHLVTISALLTKAQLHQGYLVENYPHKGSLAKNAKRKAQFVEDAKKSYWFTQQFREQTNALIELFNPAKNETIEGEEWQVFQEIFNQFIPAEDQKRTKADLK